MAVLLACAGMAQAGTRADLSGDAVIDFQTTMDMPLMAVGNLGNANDTHGDGYGGVDYAYNIGKFEVATGQYTEFLNAVAADDTYGLYNERMADPTFIEGDDFPFGGCNIQRSGSSGSYTYSIAADWADRPANYVSWGDAARFANWLTNGMPTGAQDLTTTEDGSYFLDGATTAARNAPVLGERYYYIPSEDEWYKAAFHKNDGVTGNYFDYPTSSNTTPDYIGDGQSITDPDPGNYATYDGDAGIDGIGAPYYRTEVGEHENSYSPYGTFDMAGNVGEWNEGITIVGRCVRAGMFWHHEESLHADYRRIRRADRESGDIGFRISRIGPDEPPEPVPGDFDGIDGVNDIDIDMLCDFIRDGTPYDSLYDISGSVEGVADGFVDTLDLDYLVRVLVETAIGNGTEYGDFNLDGLVDTTDLTRLATNYGPDDRKWDDGNANRYIDTDIDNTDLTILATYYGFGEPDVVPEPATLTLLAIGAAALLRRRKS